MVRIVSWNIQYGKGIDGQVHLSRACAVVKAGDPDLICFQEVSRHDPHLGGADQLRDIQQAFPGYEAFWGPALERPGARLSERFGFGNLILSRLPWTQVLHHRLPQPADPKFLSMPRQAIELSLEAGFRLLTTHLEFFSEFQQLAQVEALREHELEAQDQAALPGPQKPGTPFEGPPVPPGALICGDFNFTPESQSYAHLTSTDGAPVWEDAWRLLDPKQPHPATCGVHPDPQWPGGPHCRDYFFASGPVRKQVRRLWVDTDTTASDHQPIWLELEP